jgi:hypothetical protein
MDKPRDIVERLEWFREMISDDSEIISEATAHINKLEAQIKALTDLYDLSRIAAFKAIHPDPDGGESDTYTYEQVCVGIAAAINSALAPYKGMIAVPAPVWQEETAANFPSFELCGFELGCAWPNGGKWFAELQDDPIRSQHITQAEARKWVETEALARLGALNIGKVE